MIAGFPISHRYSIRFVRLLREWLWTRYKPALIRSPSILRCSFVRLTWYRLLDITRLLFFACTVRK